MSETPDQDAPRRIGRKDRKDRLTTGSPFPPEPPKLDPLPEPDFGALLPDRDDEALWGLAQAQDAVRPLRITPAEERFPPLKPASVPARPTAQPASPAPAPAPNRHPRARLYNLITLLALLGTIAILSVYAIIWNEPQSQLNPFPPPVRFVFVTATPPAPGANPLPQPPATPPAPLPGAAGSPFQLQAAGIVYIANANGRGCEWSSIAGTVTDASGTALNGYRVRVLGDGLDETVFTGVALAFGPGGYELPLGNAPRSGVVTVQLFSGQGAPLSDPYPVTLLAECNQNVALVNFAQVAP